MRVAPKIELTPEQTTSLEQWANGRKTPVRLAERAKIVLAAAQGQQDLEIAGALSITPKKPSAPPLPAPGSFGPPERRAPPGSHAFD